MEKSVSGITKRNKRSIRELKQKREGEGSGPEQRQRSPKTRPPGHRGDEKATTFGIWFVGIIAVVFIFFLFSVLFAETTVTVYPKTADISVDKVYTASRSDEVPGVSYSLISAEESIDMPASSTGSEYRESSASGEITIINDYSNEDLQLVSNTRFQSPDGLIYRTREPVDVPGKTGSQPGRATATIYAEKVGPEYNIGPTEFTIPGFEGTPYENLVRAESSASLTGGIATEVPVVSTSTRQAVEARATEELRAGLINSVRENLPEGFIIYDDGIFFRASITGSGETPNGEATVTVTGNLQAVTFDSNQLSTFLANDYSDDIAPESDIYIENLENFTFAIENREEFNPERETDFKFSLVGESQIVWNYDERALVRDLRGLQKDRLNEVLVNYSGIQEAEVVTRPFWKQTLPAEAEEITINSIIR